MSVLPSRLKSARATPLPCCMGSSTPAGTNGRTLKLPACLVYVSRSQITRPGRFKVSFLPACCATSVKVPSPLLLNRKLGPYSLSQNTSERLWLTMGPTTTPRPPAQERYSHGRVRWLVWLWTLEGRNSGI